ncbi:MAG: TIGR00730 family Rossman fold protein [Dehalococcoidales bacterium]|nr:TIGR00730 family Rossman fold protein [Dehalococcoidales bacterium]
MANGYEINELSKTESWRMFRIMGEFVEGFDRLSNIEPAVTIYGSARLKPEDPLYIRVEEVAFRLGQLGFSIITGGGPGVMEAANKGAARSGVASVGLNIELPDEQVCNAYATKSVTFHHFYVRKVMLVRYASAFIVMPGGLGTLDELTEVLTLIQTHKIKPFPVILFDSEYWNGFIDWMKSMSLAKQYISPEDLNLLIVSDSPEEVVNTVQTWYVKQEVAGRKAVQR